MQGTVSINIDNTKNTATTCNVYCFPCSALSYLCREWENRERISVAVSALAVIRYFSF